MRTLLKGFVADGINQPSKRSVLVENDTIIAVEDDIYGSSAADIEYNFKKEIISPGFIDVHGHSDMSLLAVPGADSKRHQGVTCEIIGNCGLSPYPVTEKNFEHLTQLYANYGIPLEWHDFSEFTQARKSRNVGLRTFSLTGHNTLRAAVAGYEQKSLSPSDLQTMQQLLDETLIQGAKGLSTGLLYTPGCFAGYDEIVTLMKVLQRHGAIYATHLRSEGKYLLESLEETLCAAKDAQLKKVQISHFKTSGKENWHKLQEAFALISKFRTDGIDVRFDRYPYTESQTMLSVILPAPFDTMADRDITIRMQDNKVVENIREALLQRDHSDWSRWRLTGTTHPYWKNFIGQKYTSLHENMVEAVIDQLVYDATTATIGAAGMSEENMIKIITDPLCMPGSDGNALPLNRKFGTAHPRAFGAIARFIRLHLDYGISIGETIAKVTGKPAEFFNLESVGTIQAGKKADITVFSPEDIDCHADFTDPHKFADGITMTMLNGNADFY